MRYNKSTITAIVLAVLLVAGTTTAFAASALSAATIYSKYNVNKNGQTYGSGFTTADETANQLTQPIVLPDLLLAVGIDGTIGYVYQSDLDGEQPENPEEAVEYMNLLKERYEEMRQTGEKYVKIIPLYAEDGETLIGEFGIGGLENTFNNNSPS